MKNHHNHHQSPNALTRTEAWGFTYLSESSTRHSQENAAPVPDVTLDTAGIYPLSMATEGDRIWIAKFRGGEGVKRRLTDMGFLPGVELQIISRTASGSVVVGVGDSRVGLGAGMAHKVYVSSQPVNKVTNSKATQMNSETHANPQPPLSSEGGITLGDLAAGKQGRVIGYVGSDRAYRSKLLSMGLTPGTEFTVTRHAPLGDPVEIRVRGFQLSLRKHEAAALQVEEVGHD